MVGVAAAITPMQARGLGLAALVAVLGYLLYPVGHRVEGVGVVLPEIESLVWVEPATSGIVSRIDVRPPAPVTPGTPLLAIVPSREAGVFSEFTMTKPGGVIPPEPPPPSWYLQAREEQLAYARAGQRWSGRVMATRPPVVWEILLAQRLALAASRRGDQRETEARNHENERRGRPEATLPHVFDPVAGISGPSDRGTPLVSPASGTLISLWAAPMVSVIEGRPIGEVMPEGTPVEVIAVVAGPVARVIERRGVRVRLDGPASVAAEAVTSVMVGQATIDAADAELLLPGLQTRTAGVIVRLRLAGPVDPHDLGAAVRYDIVTVRRPRAWGWITGR